MPRDPSPLLPLGRYLARRRKTEQLSVEAVAQLAGLTGDAVHAIESGARWGAQTATCVALLADALEVPKIAVSHHLQGHSCLRDEINARRLRGGPYGGPASHLRGSVAGPVTRAQGRGASE